MQMSTSAPISFSLFIIFVERIRKIGQCIVASQANKFTSVEERWKLIHYLFTQNSYATCICERTRLDPMLWENQPVSMARLPESSTLASPFPTDLCSRLVQNWNCFSQKSVYFNTNVQHSCPCLRSRYFKGSTITCWID